MTYSTWKHILVISDLDPGLIKGAKRMGYLYFGILAVAILIAFLIPLISIIIYGLFVVTKAPDGLDVTASRTGDRIFLHVVNTNRERSKTAKLKINGLRIRTGRIFELAANPEFEVIQTQSEEIVPVKKDLPKNGMWTFPAASVSAVELDIQQA